MHLAPMDTHMLRLVGPISAPLLYRTSEPLFHSVPLLICPGPVVPPKPFHITVKDYKEPEADTEVLVKSTH